MTLIAGATGMLGSEICRLLREQDKPVRALVRSTSNPETIARLKSSGAEIVHGDLTDPASLEAACRGVTSVISTASSTHSRQDRDSIDSVDRQGQLNLIEAAERAGARQFILISFPSIDIDFPLQSAKRAAEDRLRRGRMTYTILQPTCFMEVWLGPALGFDPALGTARIYGAGHNKVSWISFHDVAQFAVAALGNDQAAQAGRTRRTESARGRARRRATDGKDDCGPTRSRGRPAGPTRRRDRSAAEDLCRTHDLLRHRRCHRHEGRLPDIPGTEIEIGS